MGIAEQIKCVDKNGDDDNDVKPKKCSAFPNKVEKDVTKSCTDNKCNFSCDDGKPNVKVTTCSNGNWNVNNKIVIAREGKTQTTPATTTKATTPEPHCDKKCQNKENKEQNKENKKKDKENKKKDKGNKDKGGDKEGGKKKKNKKGKELEDYEVIGDYADYYDEATTTEE